jgi:hypothetical protein
MDTWADRFDGLSRGQMWPERGQTRGSDGDDPPSEAAAKP